MAQRARWWKPEWEPWLPKPLQPYQSLRLKYGLLLGPGPKVRPEEYAPTWYYQIEMMVEQSKRLGEDPARMIASLLPWVLQPEYMNDPRDVQEIMAILANRGWGQDTLTITEMLKGEAKPKEALEFLGVTEADAEPVSKQEFRAELRERTLRSFLEMFAP